MKKCRTVSGLLTSLKRSQKATLQVWDIMENSYDKKGAYLNLGEGSYSYVSSENWDVIRNHIIDQHGTYYCLIKKYSSFY